MTLGEKILIARKKRGLSQEELGKKLGVHLQTIYRWEKDETKPDISQLQKIADATAKPITFFIAEEQKPDVIEVRETEIPIVSSVGATDEKGYSAYCPFEPPYQTINFKNCKALKVESNSMAPVAYRGQKIIYSETAPVQEGDLVFIKLKNGGHLFKRYFKSKKNKMILLHSINPVDIYETLQIEEDEVEFCYKVVGVKF